MRPFVNVARRLGVRDEELKPFSAGFAGFLFALAGYFLLLPLRDEAGVSLGTYVLPRLFLASLLLTFLATPLASTFLTRSSAKEHGLQMLFRALSLSILGFMLLYLAAGNPCPVPGVQVAEVLPRGQQQQDHRQLQTAPSSSQLTAAQAAVRVAFYLWVGLLNLVAMSSLWARSADVFSPEAAGRLFGLLGAGATLGQLLGSLAARGLAHAPALAAPTNRGGPSLLPLLASAAAFELAGQAAGRYRPGEPPVIRGRHLLGVEIDTQQVDMVRQASGGHLVRQVSSTHIPRPISKGRMAASGGSVKVAVDTGDALALDAKSSSKGCARAGSAEASRRCGADAAAHTRGGLLGELLGRCLEGYRLIRASAFLQHMCAYLALNYITSSFFYFEKTLVVAQVPDASSRTAWFATINSTSAFFILGLQLLATGRVLGYLGLPIALSILPATAGLLMAGIAAWPVPSAVAAAEVLRKVLAYSLARPARESLYTVVSREEKYGAKIFMDTVVQRMGDTMAAAAFQALVPSLGLGPAGMAAACVPVCVAWTAVAFHLGQRQQRLAASAAGAKLLPARIQFVPVP